MAFREARRVGWGTRRHVNPRLRRRYMAKLLQGADEAVTAAEPVDHKIYATTRWLIDNRWRCEPQAGFFVFHYNQMVTNFP